MEENSVPPNDPSTDLSLSEDSFLYPIKPFTTLPENSPTSTADTLPSSQPLVQPVGSSSGQVPTITVNQPTPAAYPLITPNSASKNTPDQPLQRNPAISSNTPDSLPFKPASSSSKLLTGTLPAKMSTRENTTTTTDSASASPGSLPAASITNLRDAFTTDQKTTAPTGGIIALGVLTSFFVLLTIGLLLWRRRRRSLSERKDAVAKMEEIHIQASTERGSSTQSSSTKQSLFEKSSAASGLTKFNPFARRGIVRASRPPSLLLGQNHPRNPALPQPSPHSLNEVALPPLFRTNPPIKRPASWRSSIANAWANLGLPARVLNDPTSRSSPCFAFSPGGKSTRTMFKTFNFIPTDHPATKNGRISHVITEENEKASTRSSHSGESHLTGSSFEGSSHDPSKISDLSRKDDIDLVSEIHTHSSQTSTPTNDVRGSPETSSDTTTLELQTVTIENGRISTNAGLSELAAKPIEMEAESR